MEKFIKSLKAYGVLKSVKNSNAQLEMSDLVDEDIEITDETAVSGDCLYVFTYVGVITSGSRVIKVYPKYLLSPKEAPVKEMKQVIFCWYAAMVKACTSHMCLFYDAHAQTILGSIMSCLVASWSSTYDNNVVVCH